jgi:hypothetical protein
MMIADFELLAGDLYDFGFRMEKGGEARQLAAFTW